MVDGLSEGSIVTVRVSTPAGELVMTAEIESYGRELVLAGLHIQTETLRPNSLGWARLRQLARAVAEKVDAMLSLLKARLGPPVRTMEGSPVTSGSPARYLLRADPNFTKSVSAIWALVKRHVPLATAKAEIERVLIGEEIMIDLPMLEDAVLFEGEMRKLGVRAVREISAAAEG
jgi:hypothetical protein